jgi:hypothetical protein
MESWAFAIVCHEHHLQTKVICEVGTLSQENQSPSKQKKYVKWGSFLLFLKRITFKQKKYVK